MLKRSIFPSLAFLAAAVVSRAPASGAEPETSISGRWKLLIQVEERRKDYNLELKQEGSKVTGALVSPRTNKRDTFDGGTFADGKLKLEVKREGGETFAIEAEQKAPTKFEGKVVVNGEGSAPIIIVREGAGPVLGKWNVVSKSPDGQEYASTLDLTEDGGVLKGKSTSRVGTVDLTSLVFDGEKLNFEIALPIDGNNVAFQVSTDFKDGNKLVGRWKTRDADFSGEWSATREVALAAPAKGVVGKWFGISTTSKGEKKSIQLDLAVDGNKLTGKVRTSKGESEIQGGKVDGGKIELTFPYKADGGDVQIKVEAEVDAHDVLKGKWTAGSEAGELSARKPTTL